MSACLTFCACTWRPARCQSPPLVTCTSSLSDLRLICCASGRNSPYLPVFSLHSPAMRLENNSICPCFPTRFATIAQVRQAARAPRCDALWYWFAGSPAEQCQSAFWRASLGCCLCQDVKGACAGLHACSIAPWPAGKHRDTGQSSSPVCSRFPPV
jgi:hypothetical protein